MDVAKLCGISNNFGPTGNLIQYSGNGTVNLTSRDFAGNKTDALSAVKLDPAVLEAQVTVVRPEKDSTNAQTDLNNTRSVLPKKESKLQSYMQFKDMVMKQEAALLSLTPQHMDLLMKYTDTLRRQRQATQKQLECSFCKNNGEAVRWYSSHCLKDSRGHVKCPVLRAFRCNLCGATGDRAHTIKYCPENILFNSDYWNR